MHCKSAVQAVEMAWWSTPWDLLGLQVQRQVHANLSHDDEALLYVEELMYQILSSLCANQPRTTLDMEERVWKTFPHPIDQWAVKEAQRALDNHKKKQVIVFPADKLHSLLQKVRRRSMVD